MDDLRLGPPLDRRFLRKLASALIEDGWSDLSGMVGWLTRHGSGESMAAAICDAWSGTSLPLRAWAARVGDVEVWLRSNDLRIAVRISGNPDMIAWQTAPFETAAFEAMAAMLPHPLPELLRDAALSAPGMVLDRVGPLAAPRYLAKPLEYVTRWAEGIGREECERLGFEYPDPKRHLVEVLDNGLGDCYVLGTDGTMYFFDHEACGLVRCNVTLEGLLHQYFASPQGILDPYEQKWAQRPRETPSAEPWPDPPSVVLSLKGQGLPCLASIALAVRGCQRAMPREWLRTAPHEWQAFQDALGQIIERCKEVATTGTPLSRQAAKDARRTADIVTAKWKKLCGIGGKVYPFEQLTYFALPALATACHRISDAEAIEEAVASCQAVYTGSDRQDETVTQAAIGDADYLLSLKLGEPGTVGKPVPSAFFERPLWPGWSPRETWNG